MPESGIGAALGGKFEGARGLNGCGHLVFNVRDDIYEQQGFRERQDELEAAGRWRLLERSDPFRPFTLKEPHLRARILVYEVA